MSHEKALEAAAVAISGAPFPTKRSLSKAKAAIDAYLSALVPDEVAGVVARLDAVAHGSDRPYAASVAREAASTLTALAARAEKAERERNEARKYLSAASRDYDRLLSYLETSYQSTNQPLPFEEAFAAAAKECRETSEFLQWASEGRAVGYIYDDELSKGKARITTLEAENAALRARLEEAGKVIEPFAKLALPQHCRAFMQLLVCPDGDTVKGDYAPSIRAARRFLEEAK